MKVFKTEEQVDAAYNKADKLMQMIAQHNGKRIAKSDCGEEYTARIETALNKCAQHLKHASSALDELDSAATNFEDVEFELMPIIDHLVESIEKHEVWKHLKFDEDKEAERYWTLHGDEEMAERMRQLRIKHIDDMVQSAFDNFNGTQASC